MKTVDTNYFVGLDMGTNSVGWAVTTENYELMKFHNKAMWGTRLFEEASQAAERRTFRSARRRLARKKWRLNILAQLFEQEIVKVDDTFFLRMKDSALWMEDKNKLIDTAYCLFNDKDYTDVDYHKEFPTIYHLRAALLKNAKQYDIRLVYLALHNILKHRGHFLFEGKNMTVVTSFKNVFDDVAEYLKDEMGIELSCVSESDFEAILKNKRLSKTRKRDELSKLCGITKDEKQTKAILGLLAGTTEDLSIVYNDETLKELEKSKISFASGSYDEDRENLDSALQERSYLIDKLKALYDWSILEEILSGGEMDGQQYLSVAKISIYEKHKKDLAILKKVVRTYCPDKYKDLFSASDVVGNYASYVGHVETKGKKSYVKKCDKDTFYKYLGGILNHISAEDEDVEYIKNERNAGTLLPLQISGDNGVIPYQVHRMELIKILDNAATYLPFLNNVDESGYSVKEKIIKTFEFRIPYYVGPLNEAHKEQDANCWIQRKESGAILPWNFEDKVDIDSSAEAFISRMTNKCTYLFGENVLPRNSLIYCEFTVWNELNNVCIRGEKLDVTLKKDIFEHVFKKYKKVTGKRLLDYLKSEGYEVTKEELSGFDQDFTSSLGMYHDFKKLLGDRMQKDTVVAMVEQIIFWMTVYSDGGKILKRKIKAVYGDQLKDVEIDKICRMKCSGWGALSQKLLTGIEGAECATGECKTIMQFLRDGNDNFRQLLGSQYTFEEMLKEESGGNKKTTDAISYKEIIKDLYVPPAVKRSIWQTIQIVEEIKKCKKAAPAKIFIEMARGPEEDRRRTVSRKEQLLQLYEAMQHEVKYDKDWISLIENMDENTFRIQDVFLYFTQMGKDMYTGKSIDLEEILGASHAYDRDHIYPQSKTKDDSILNNLVLVNKNDNKRKSDGLVPADIQQEMESFWKMLRKHKMITEEKYRRLTRKTEFTTDDLAGFISRQLVETRQSTKATASVLKELYPNTEIVYVKAGVVADFKRDKLDTVKVRDLNDYHHAKDAYLNIVVGNVYHSKFTRNPAKWFSENKNAVYSLNRMFDFDLEENGKEVWKKGKGGSIQQVQATVDRNDILFTRYSMCNSGGLFDQQLVPAGKGKVPAKQTMATENWTKKYGGYNSLTPAYFVLVESVYKKKTIRTIEAVPLYVQEKFQKDEGFAKAFLCEKYGLEEPRIVIPVIKKYSKMVINGFPMHLNGTTGSQLLFYVAAQLVVNRDTEKYLKKITKYLERNAKRRDKKKNLEIVATDGVTKEQNLLIYDAFMDKLTNTIYAKRPANPIKTLEEKREQFLELSLEEECIVLGEVLHLFQCRSVTANLVMLGGVPNVGKTKYSKKITNYESVKLVNQSVTGLYQNEVDLLKL